MKPTKPQLFHPLVCDMRYFSVSFSLQALFPVTLGYKVRQITYKLCHMTQFITLTDGAISACH